MRRRKQDGKGGYDGERREQAEAQSVDDHRRELPVTALVLEALVLTQFRRDGSQLAEDAFQQADGQRAASATTWNSVHSASRRLAAVEERGGRWRRVRAEANRRAMTTASSRPTVRPSTVGAHHVVAVHASGAAPDATAVKHPIIVLEIKNVGQQALRRSLPQLYFAYFTTLLSRRSAGVVLDVAAGTLHAQHPRQVLAHTFPYLQQLNQN